MRLTISAHETTLRWGDADYRLAQQLTDQQLLELGYSAHEVIGLAGMTSIAKAEAILRRGVEEKVGHANARTMTMVRLCADGEKT